MYWTFLSLHKIVVHSKETSKDILPALKSLHTQLTHSFPFRERFSFEKCLILCVKDIV